MHPATRPSRRTVLLAGLLVAAVLPAMPARADDGAKATAEQLFQEGKALARRGLYTEACARFAASQRLEPAIGTQLNLADCLERTGKLASAWAHYREVIPLAERERQDARAALARARATALEPRVPRLIVRIDGDELERDASGQALEVTRDGVLLERPLWGTPLYVDPGRHEVRATGPGLQPFLEAVTVAEGETAEVDVRLRAKDDDGATAPALASPPRRAPRPSTGVAPWWRRRPAATLTGAVGVVAVGTSLAFGLAAKDQWDSAHEDRDCVDGYCSERGQARTDRARTFATVSTATAVTGLVAIAASVVLGLGSRREQPRVVVFAVDHGAGLSWAGELP